MINVHPPLEASSQTAPLILIVDDVPENGFIAKRRLVRLGYECIAVQSGPAALEALLVTRPALMLLDFMMPDMDGLAVLRKVRSNPKFSDLPVIMLTARTDAEAVVASLNDGADDYLHKPIDFTVLKARIDLQLNRNRDVRALQDANNRLDWQAASRAIELDEVRNLLRDRIDRTRDFETHLRAGGKSDTVELAQLAESLRRLLRLSNRLASDAYGYTSPASLREMAAMTADAVDLLNNLSTESS